MPLKILLHITQKDKWKRSEKEFPLTLHSISQNPFLLFLDEEVRCRQGDTLHKRRFMLLKDLL